MSEDEGERLIITIYRSLERYSPGTSAGKNLQDLTADAERMGHRRTGTRIKHSLKDLEALGLAEQRGRNWFKMENRDNPSPLTTTDNINDFFVELEKLIQKHFKVVPR